MNDYSCLFLILITGDKCMTLFSQYFSCQKTIKFLTSIHLYPHSNIELFFLSKINNKNRQFVFYQISDKCLDNIERNSGIHH